MEKPLLVKEFMAASLVTFTPDQSVLSAIQALVERRISGAPVVDHHGNLVGMFSEQDCLKVALNAAYYDEWDGRVSEYMTRGVETVDAEMGLVDLAEKFLKGPPRRYPVMQDNRLVGQISRRDILKALTHYASHLGKLDR